MKKALLSLALFAGLSAAAEVVTFDFVNNDYGLNRLSGTTDEYIADGTSITQDGVTLTFASTKGEESKNQSGCRLWSSGFRMYNGGTVTITANDNIAAVTIDPAVSTISITPGDEAWTLAYTESTKNGQFKTLTVTLGDAPVVDPDPEPTPDPEIAKANSIKETIALDSKTKFEVNYALTVGFVRYNNVFACDAAGDFIQLYGKNTLEVGDVIPAGWEGTYELYNGVTPEITNFTLPEVEKGTFEPAAVAASDVTVDLVNSVVLIKDVVLAEDSPAGKANFTGTVGDVELSFRNNYELESVEAGTYDITVVVTIFQGAPSLYVVNYAKAESTGIETIEVDHAAAVYFNLQGVEVANPESGIYIVRRGNKVTKEVK